ncbi:hypothetical protein [Heterosigma akashiwo virus 01]|uniref:Uncharacterized protein n=1 Tax=Heterosigma akashiwo virus 01 TaxID=97195 RepID=A0A1C9C5B2_HAV01|nr:hypothetical protein D1R72_gp148 [Heterosigma akashiwo virus 01]AOM63479.1 hypothetical protein [Heterosigma akashiwo virus 01]
MNVDKGQTFSNIRTNMKDSFKYKDIIAPKILNTIIAIVINIYIPYDMYKTINILKNTEYINEETGEKIKTFRHEVAFLKFSISLLILSACFSVSVFVTYLLGKANKRLLVLGYFLRILYLFAMLILYLLNLTHSIPWAVKTTGYKGEFDNRTHFGLPGVLIAIALISTTIGYLYPLVGLK